MQLAVEDNALDTSTFFAGLPAMTAAEETFDRTKYGPAPDDWLLALTDIENSTRAIAEGRHNSVNIVAAAAIAALKNLCAPTPIPFLFGGDGAVVMVPKSYAADARINLARLRGMAEREFGLNLRVGIVDVAELRRRGADVLVGRYQPSPGNNFGVFSGGGVGMLETAMKEDGHPELSGLAAIPASLDDGEPVDMAGLSCRWNALKSVRGTMLTLIVQDATEPKEMFQAVMRLAAEGGDPRPNRPDNLKASWPSKGFMLEARVNRGKRSLWLAVLKVLAETFLARLVLALGRPVGRFDPNRYREEIARNTDFGKCDANICLVLDCPTESVEAIRRLLDKYAERGTLRYGMHLSDQALMTCLVSSATDNAHVHFIDGGDGGYTSAAKRLKRLPGA